MKTQIKQAATYIKKEFGNRFDLALVLGSGLSRVVNQLNDSKTLNYSTIPHFKTSTVKGHVSKLIFGTLHGKKILCMTGRFHYYEGYTMKDIAFPFYVFKELGIQKVILTNSCGGINTSMLFPGTIMVINDFINLMPSNPLIGENLDEYHPRFPDMTEPYSKQLRSLAKEKANELDIPYIEGVYAGFMGPYYETKAEIKMISTMGADAVGMSTVPETIICHAMDIQVLAFATITNMATGIQPMKHSHDRVVEVANKAAVSLANWINTIVKSIE